jgi:hypothetical protein
MARKTDDASRLDHYHRHLHRLLCDRSPLNYVQHRTTFAFLPTLELIPGSRELFSAFLLGFLKAIAFHDLARYLFNGLYDCWHVQNGGAHRIREDERAMKIALLL